MGITPGFKDSDVRKYVDDFLDDVEAEVINMLMELGERAVMHAQGLPEDVGFHDHTGNLRASIGYMVFKDGVPVVKINQQLSDNAKSLGIQKGTALAERIGSQHDGLCLVVTAGMNYALYVESNGRDVLASAESMTRKAFAQQVEQLKKMIQQRPR